MSTYTPILIEEAFPIAEPPARGVDCVGWSPHNVLLVATRWSVQLYTGSLSHPAAAVRPRHHPLCYRSNEETADTVVGAKWSTSLVPEARYPAEARVCVRTAGNLVVYRVSRGSGGGAVSVSNGVGIGANFHPANITVAPRGLTASSLSPQSEEDDDPIKADRPTHKAPAKTTAKKTSKGKSRAARPAPKKNSAKPTAKRGSRQRRRGSSSSSESADSSDTDDSDRESYSSSDSSCSSGSSSTSRTSRDDGDEGSSSGSGSDSQSTSASVLSSPSSARSSRKRPRGKTGRAAPPVKKPPPKQAQSGQKRQTPDADGVPSAQHDASSPLSHLSPSTAGSQDSGARQRHCLLDYFWLPGDVLVVVTTTGIHRVPLGSDFTDDERPQVRPLPPPLHEFDRDAAGQAGHAAPACACLVQVHSSAAPLFSAPGVAETGALLLVAGPFVLRLMLLDEGGVTMPAMVQVPTLTSVPSCIYATLECGSSHHAGTSEASAPFTLGILLSAPSGTVRANVSLPLAVLKAARRERPEGASPAELAWQPTILFTGRRFSEDPFLRGFAVAPISAILPPSPNTQVPQADDGASPQPSALSSTEFLVFGVGRRCLHGFASHSNQTMTLFRCPPLAAATEMPADAAVAVCGVSMHPSCTVGVLVVQAGHPTQDPVQVILFAANDRDAFPYRMLRGNGVVSPEDWAATAAEPAGTLVTPAPQNVSPYQRSEAFLRTLWRRQRHVDFFTWEPLFPRASERLALRTVRDAWTQFRQSPHALAARHRVSGDGTPLTGMAVEGAALRRRYCQLRKTYGVSLFLRFPAPDSYAPSYSLSPSPLPLSGESTDEKGEEATLTRFWWRLLLALWRRCPWDSTALMEMVLANAVSVVAKRAGFAGMSLTAGERFWEDEECPSGTSGVGAASSPWAYSYSGALEFLRLYVAAQQANLVLLRDAGTLRTETWTDASGLHWALADSRDGRAGARAPSLALWASATEWVKALEDFVVLCEPKCHGSRGVGAKAVQRGSPCSVCDAADAAALCARTFSCASVHMPAGATAGASPERHTTVFSPKTFAPLSLFSQEAVLTRCTSCGLADFAAGPCCRVCGGLLQ